MMPEDLVPAIHVLRQTPQYDGLASCMLLSQPLLLDCGWPLWSHPQVELNDTLGLHATGIFGGAHISAFDFDLNN